MDREKSAEHKGDISVKEIADRSLRAILSGQYGEAEVNDLVRVCHALAVPYVRRRLSTDILLRRTLELNMSDFAYDCIADLFAFAGSGEFPHIEAYFAAYPYDRFTGEEMLSHLRRLVFSQVNHGIFRLYNEVDPSLGKVLRNIKLALQQFRSLVVVEIFGEPCLAPAEGDRLIEGRVLDIDELEAGLRGYLRGTENIPFMLGKLALFLQENEYVSRVIPMTSVAIVFRNLYSRSSEMDDVASVTDDRLESANLAGVVHEAVQKTRDKMALQYVRKRRIRTSLLDAYFIAIETRLLLTFSGDGHDRGLRELLSEQLKGMTEAEYRSKHRSRLEYFSRLAGEEVARRLRQR